MRKTLRISRRKTLIYSPRDRGYYDPEDIGGGTIYRPKKKRQATKHRVRRQR